MYGHGSVKQDYRGNSEHGSVKQDYRGNVRTRLGKAGIQRKCTNIPRKSRTTEEMYGQGSVKQDYRGNSEQKRTAR